MQRCRFGETEVESEAKSQVEGRREFLTHNFLAGKRPRNWHGWPTTTNMSRNSYLLILMSDAVIFYSGSLLEKLEGKLG